MRSLSKSNRCSLRKSKSTLKGVIDGEDELWERKSAVLLIRKECASVPTTAVSANGQKASGEFRYVPPILLSDDFVAYSDLYCSMSRNRYAVTAGHSNIVSGELRVIYKVAPEAGHIPAGARVHTHEFILITCGVA